MRSELYCLVQQHAARLLVHTEVKTKGELPRFIKDEITLPQVRHPGAGRASGAALSFLAICCQPLETVDLASTVVSQFGT